MPIALSRRHLIATGLAAATPIRALAEPPTIPAAALLEDARIFRRAYTELHPGLLRYSSAAELSARFDELRVYLSRPRTLAQAHLAFARFTAAVRCGHSYLNPTNQAGAALALISGGRTRLPFRFRRIDGRMIVIEDSAADPALVRGAEILSIGGVAASRLLNDLLPLAHSDGHNDAARVRQMEVRGEETWEAFDIYLPLVHPALVDSGVARLRVRSPTGSERTVEVGLLSRAERASTIENGVSTKGTTEPAWRVERPSGGGAWLTMRSWALFDSRWDWTAALNASLDELASDNAPALIIDLRGNAGGLDVGDVILSRLVDRDTPKSDMRRFTRYRKTPADLDPHLETWDRSFRDWGEQAVGPDKAGFYRLTRYDDAPDGDLIRPSGRRFKGRVMVLVDASNSSATFQFADSVKRHGLGMLVGETTGGNRRGINGGAFFFLKLPGSGLEIDLPLIGAFPATPQPDAGIIPDVAVTTTVADIALGRDPVREAALARLNAA